VILGICLRADEAVGRVKAKPDPPEPAGYASGYPALRPHAAPRLAMTFFTL